MADEFKNGKIVNYSYNEYWDVEDAKYEAYNNGTSMVQAVADTVHDDSSLVAALANNGVANHGTYSLEDEPQTLNTEQAMRAAYQGDPSGLCVNDARSKKEIAEAAGYDSIVYDMNVGSNGKGMGGGHAMSLTQGNNAKLNGTYGIIKAYDPNLDASVVVQDISNTFNWYGGEGDSTGGVMNYHIEAETGDGLVEIETKAAKFYDDVVYENGKSHKGSGVGFSTIKTEDYSANVITGQYQLNENIVLRASQIDGTVRGLVDTDVSMTKFDAELTTTYVDVDIAYAKETYQVDGYQEKEDKLMDVDVTLKYEMSPNDNLSITPSVSARSKSQCSSSGGDTSLMGNASIDASYKNEGDLYNTSISIDASPFSDFTDSNLSTFDPSISKISASTSAILENGASGKIEVSTTPGLYTDYIISADYQNKNNYNIGVQVQSRDSQNDLFNEGTKATAYIGATNMFNQDLITQLSVSTNDIDTLSGEKETSVQYSASLSFGNEQGKEEAKRERMERR